MAQRTSDTLADDISDASTIVNVSLLKRGKTIVRPTDKEKTVKEDASSSNSNQAGSACKSELSIRINDCNNKVVSWLDQHSMVNPQEDLDTEEEAIHEFVSLPRTNETNLAYSMKYRIHAFLLEVKPNLPKYSIDLISGHCNDGCKRFTVYSSIHWSKEGSFNVPTCPDCFSTGVKKTLLLTFKFKLLVLDRDGHHMTIHLCHTEAEKFLGCSAVDFLRKESVRDVAILPLVDYSASKTYEADFTPLMELCIVPAKGVFFVVDSILRNSSLRK
ncbi:uncharacterized protein LOC128985730 [Macrosteles quadrilineatus]|uniref:uncharacterized protein LOC128985730 n=1 Tax=Macrosteles quadrilineatus TaxID=74068 RepID=UPI0023E0E208|nr:uncharacterized protein LOC128985730 [Macrosteles quadrilineatus]XP_054261521.1 uncharacterized protein LOC128985730 [Macrosteles quadrilineatus]XP_054261522.1 uncharacterized protein LOC128985730 [Macrosteles quadrilineatus]XP_054261523.1 uncharacterized protein LOC128985730 [Macrosteles quadrilineatus]